MSKNIRTIIRLDIKGGNVIKGIQFECLRVIGNPQQIAEGYYLDGVDELLYIDTVANLYERKKIVEIVREASSKIHIPLTAGGGVRTILDVKELLNAGADKVAINTEATKNPKLIFDSAQMFGSQCIVASIQAKRKKSQKWEAYVDHGREPTGLDVIEWAKEVQKLGAGEILLTSVDMDGTERGMDNELIEAVSKEIDISLVVSGGIGKLEDFENCMKNYKIDGIAAASVFHYNKYSISDLKNFLNNKGIGTRKTKSKIKISTNSNQKYDIDNYNKYTLKQLGDESLRVKSSYSFEEDRSTKKNFDIGVVNYGINNLQSVIKAFEKIGKKASWVETPEDVMKSKALVIPGVGAFASGMKGLNEKKLLEPIREKSSTDTPILGICLGMQLLFSESEEFGITEGINLIPGKVISLNKQINNNKIKIPHIGWNKILRPSYNQGTDWSKTVLKSVDELNDVYFIHSFYAAPEDNNITIATSSYGGFEFCTAIKYKNITATQFHPEKSGETGLKILEDFCKQLDK